MIERSISSNSPEWTVRRLTPWAASDTSALVSEFYTTVYGALPRKFQRKARKRIAGLLKLASGPANAIPVAGKGVSETAKLASDWLKETKPFNEQFDDLSDQLVQIGAKILIIIDDLDRLHSDELTTLFKVVRLLGSFDGIHYLLSYDQETIRDVLSRTPIAFDDTTRALEYLEKIVQYPFEVPPLQETHRYREIRDLLAAIIDNHSLDVPITSPGKRELVDTFLDLIPDSDLITLRSIRRLANQFEVVLTSIGPNEVCFIDLLLLTFLRLTYPELYAKLRDWKTDLTRLQPRVVYMNDSSKGVEWGEKIEPYLNDKKESLGSLHKLIHFLFPDIQDTSRNVFFSRKDPDYRQVCG